MRIVQPNISSLFIVSIEDSEEERSESIENTNKDYKIAALLAIFTGGFGLHKFYMGKYMIGAIYLIFCWTWIPGVIGIIEGIKYLLDGQEKFLEKLND